MCAARPAPSPCPAASATSAATAIPVIICIVLSSRTGRKGPEPGHDLPLPHGFVDKLEISRLAGRLVQPGDLREDELEILEQPLHLSILARGGVEEHPRRAQQVVRPDGDRAV